MSPIHASCGLPLRDTVSRAVQHLTAFDSRRQLRGSAASPTTICRLINTSIQACAHGCARWWEKSVWFSSSHVCMLLCMMSLILHILWKNFPLPQAMRCKIRGDVRLHPLPQSDAEPVGQSAVCPQWSGMRDLRFTAKVAQSTRLSTTKQKKMVVFRSALRPNSCGSCVPPVSVWSLAGGNVRIGALLGRELRL